MKLCDLTLATPEENLACDEALLDLCEAGHSGDILRFWEPSRHFVVLGYANKAAREAALPFCRASNIPPIWRRVRVDPNSTASQAAIRSHFGQSFTAGSTEIICA